MLEVDAAKRLAYKYLDTWIERYKAEYKKDISRGDYQLAMSFLLKEDGTSYAPPEEMLAASILEEALAIEGVLESEGKDIVYEGDTETIYEVLRGRLRFKVDKLEKLAALGVSALLEEEKKKSRREQQLEVILVRVSELGYDRMAIPDDGKGLIKDYCIKNYRKIFTEDGFKKAWSAGVKAKRFRMLNHDKFTKGH